MPKFEVDMEITGLKLRMRGDTSDIPQLSRSVQQQLNGFLPHLENIAPNRHAIKAIEVTDVPASGATKSTKRTSRPRRTPSAENGEAENTFNWEHSPDKWGNPRQSWSAWEKIVWLLFVAKNENVAKELTGPQIAKTFNLKFREAGALHRQNMPRDLGNLKQKSPALVGSHNEHSRNVWFLTDEGAKEGLRLVSVAKGAAST